MGYPSIRLRVFYRMYESTGCIYNIYTTLRLYELLCTLCTLCTYDGTHSYGEVALSLVVLAWQSVCSSSRQFKGRVRQGCSPQRQG